MTSTQIFDNWNYLLKKGLTEDERNNIYNKMSPTYEQDVEKLNSTIHSRFARSVAKLVPDGKESAKILDVGAGTGQLGKELHKCGFQNMVAVDPAEKMLDIAVSHGVYRKVFAGDLKEYRAIEPTGGYDMVISVGVLIPNHMPPQQLQIACDLLKKGGYLAFLTRAAVVENPDDYGREVLQCLHQFENAGTMQKLDWEHFDKYHGDVGTIGINILYQKC